MSEIYNEYSHNLWTNALNIALATCPQDYLRDMAHTIRIENVDRMVDELPDGMLGLVRRCIEVVADNSALPIKQQRELADIANAMLRGKNSEFDKWMLARG